jgi:hypothetical protein
MDLMFINTEVHLCYLSEVALGELPIRLVDYDMEDRTLNGKRKVK